MRYRASLLALCVMSFLVPVSLSGAQRAAEAPGDTAPVATAPGMALEPDEVSRVELHLAPSARPLRRDLVAGSTPTDEETTREQAAGLRPADPTRRDASAPAIPWDDGAVEEPGYRSEPIRGQPRPQSPQGWRRTVFSTYPTTQTDNAPSGASVAYVVVSARITTHPH